MTNLTLNSRSVISTAGDRKSTADYATHHYMVFANEWLPQVHPEVDAAFTTQPLSLLADLYHVIYLYGPQGEKWLMALDKMMQLTTDQTFVTDLYDTFHDIFDIYGGNYRVDQGKKVETMLRYAQKVDRAAHRGGTEDLVTDLFNGEDPNHPAYKTLKAFVAYQKSLLTKPAFHFYEENGLSSALIFFSYYYLLQDLFLADNFLKAQTKAAHDFLTRWDM